MFQMIEETSDLLKMVKKFLDDQSGPKEDLEEKEKDDKDGEKLRKNLENLDKKIDKLCHNFEQNSKFKEKLQEDESEKDKEQVCQKENHDSFLKF